MKRVLDESLIYEILSVVEEIPEGCVGRVLSMAQFYGKYPCHRVVNHAGRLAPHFPEQMERLLAEGVTFRENGCVDMKKHQWDC